MENEDEIDLLQTTGTKHNPDALKYYKEATLDIAKQYLYEKETAKVWRPGEDMVPYSGPYFDEEEILSAIETLLEGWLVMGDKCARLERKLPEYFGKKFGVLTNSGSSANLLMLSALKLPRSTQVLAPVGGFPTTINPIFQTGKRLLPVDIDDSFNPDLDEVEELLDCLYRLDPQSLPHVFTFAHALGNSPDMHRVMRLVEKYNMVLLEDCCDAMGGLFDGEPLGSFGTMASCSFYPAHHITMGEGGFVACNTKEMEDRIRSMREWGRGCYCVGPKANALKCGTCKERFKPWNDAFPDEIFDHKYVYTEIGYNLKPIEVSGAMGLKQLKKLDTIHELRRRNFELMDKIYQPYEEFFTLPKATHLCNPSWFAYAVTLKKECPFKRADLVDWLEEHKIQTRPYFAGNILLQPAYRNVTMMDVKTIKTEFPKATHAMLNTFFHGTSPVITLDQIAYIKEVVDKFMEKY